MAEPKGQWALIDWIRRSLRTDAEAVPIGPGDDMALVRLAGETEFLITVDVLLEGTHFDLRAASPRQVGYKAMAVSLSDAAAMASLPVAAVAWVGLPESATMRFARDLNRGLWDAADRFQCPIVGGDVTSWPRGQGGLTIGTALVSRAAGVRPVRRSGARPGDWLLVTGLLGGSILGRHLEFLPRVAEARELARQADLHAMIDLSDGLSTDLAHLCRESGAAAEVQAAAVPISPDAARLAQKDGRTPLEHALNDGEDFELLLAVGPEDGARLAAAGAVGGVALAHIGQVVAGAGVTLVGPDGRREPLRMGGWEHFR
jgi:thiamine-monophosphate kinase